MSWEREEEGRIFTLTSYVLAVCRRYGNMWNVIASCNLSLHTCCAQSTSDKLMRSEINIKNAREF